MQEKTLEGRLKREVERCGGRAYKFVSPSVRGVPDRLVCMPQGRVYFVEMKKPKGGKVDPLQEYRMKELQRLGCNVRIVWNVEQLEAFIKEVCDEVHTS